MPLFNPEFANFLHFTVDARTDTDEAVHFDCTPDNTELYYHQEQYAEVDHIFHRLQPGVRRELGAFIWRSILGNEEFNRIANAMVYSGNWRIRFNPVPTEGDMEQYTHQFNPSQTL